MTRTSWHPYGLRLHLVEADRVSTPDKLGGMLDGLGYTEGTNPNTGNKIYDGVEVDSSGMIRGLPRPQHISA